MTIIEFSARLVAAATLAALAGGCSYAAARRLLPSAGLTLRWTATCVVSLWVASVGFHALIAFGAFRLTVALPCLLLIALLMRLSGRLTVDDFGGIADDLRLATDRLREVAGAGPARWLAAGAGLALAAVATRGLAIPVVAWDSLTYHAVKAGLWTQTGTAIDFVAPGGWSIYRSYPGGGEALQAWAMLPFAADWFVGCVDVLLWTGLGVALLALAREIGLRAGAAAAAACFVLLLPAAARSVGSLYVDVTLAALLVAACALICHAVRLDRLPAAALGFAALGLAAGVKAFALPVLALAPWPAIWLLRRSWATRRGVAWLGAGALGVACALAPWILDNWRLTGLPFSPLPLEVAGVTLGRTNESMAWYLNRPELADAGLGHEFRALAALFGLPGVVACSEPTLGAWTLLPVLLFLPGAVRLARTRGRTALVIVLFVAPALFAYFGEGLRDTRLLWSAVSGRYLLSAIGLIVLVSVAAFPPGGRAERIYVGLLSLAASLYFLVTDVHGWRASESILALGAGAAVAGGVLVVTRERPPGPRSRRRLPLAVATLVALTVLAAGALREASMPDAMRESVSLHPSPRYFLPAVERLAASASPRTLAVTAGPHQDADNWYLYPFLGRRLANRLLYVPVTRDGEMADFARYDALVSASDYESWRTRLAERGVTEVLSFSPTSLELLWMERRPREFERLEGDGRHWGLYALRTRSTSPSGS